MSVDEPGRSDRRWIRQLGVLSGVGLTLVISTVLGFWGATSWTGGWEAPRGSCWWGSCSASRQASSISSARRGSSAARGNGLNVTAPTDLGRGVWLVTGLLGLGLAGLCALLRGPADALGALVGSGLMLLNFGGLTWAAERALAGRAASRPVWIGASGLRLGLVGGLVGLAVTQTGVGLPGLLLSLTLVPVAVILTGLRAARAV